MAERVASLLPSLILATIIGSWAASAFASPKVVVDATCPRGSERPACLNYPFYGPGDANGTSSTVELTGRLNNGRAQKLSVSFTPDPQGEDQRALGLAATIGFSKAGHSILLTDRGTLEVLTEGYGFRPEENVVIINERTWTLVRAYLNAFEPYIAVRGGGVSVWIEREGRCVSPLAKARYLVAGNHCSSENKLEASAHLERAVGVNVLKLQQTIPSLSEIHFFPSDKTGTEFGGDGNALSLYRVRGTPYLLVFVRCTDCD